MKIHQLSVAESLESVCSSEQGLSFENAAARLKKYGPNQIESMARQSWIIRLLKEFTGLFSTILWIAAALAFLADWYDPNPEMVRVGLAVILVILVSGLFSFWQEMRVEETLKALQNLLPPQVEALRNGITHTVPVDSLVPGDVIFLGQGDNVPADCRLIESFGIRINRATVTGESHPQSCDARPSTQERYTDSRNIVLAGTSVVAGRGRAVVFATGRHTEFGQIAHLTQSTGEVDSPLRREIAHLSKVIALLALGMGLIFFIAGHVINVPLWRDVLLSLGIIIAMVPEGLLPTLTLSLVLAAQRLAKKNVLIRHLPSVETLGSVTVICTDKTGTLTEGRMRASRLLLGLNAMNADDIPACAGLVSRHEMFFKVGRFCHELTERLDHNRLVLDGDPLEKALVEMSAPLVLPHPEMRRVDEWPFDSERMRQSVLYQEGDVSLLYCKGALEAILPRCRSIALDGGVQELSGSTKETILDAQEEMTSGGLRVIALAFRRIDTRDHHENLEQELTFCGLAGLEDPPRPEVDIAVAKCQSAGIKVVMVTGDLPRTALAIAQKVGIVKSADTRVISGSELQNLSRAQLQLALDAPEIIFARVAADQKMHIVEALKDKGHIVAVTGDGVNDAAALRTAHIGIGMGLSGTDVAKAAADMLLLDDHFASIVNAIEEGRATFQNIRKFLTYVLVHNTAELLPSLAFALFRIPLPLTPVQALAIDMGTDSLTALGLGIEPGHPNAMTRPPRPRTTRLLSGAVAWRAYLFLGLIEAGAGLAAFFDVLHRGGWHYGMDLAATELLYREATTACFAAIVVLQIVNVMLCRSSVRSLVSTGLLGNPLILWGILWELVLLILIAYTPWGNAFFGTAPLSMDTWLHLLPWAVGMLVLEEIRKFLVRRRWR